MGLEYHRTVSKHQERHATKPSSVPPLPSSFSEPNPCLLLFALYCVCRRSKCLCFRVSLCGRTTFWLHLWPAAHLRCRPFQHTGHFFFLYRFLKVKILKERPKPFLEIRLLEVYLLFCVLGCSDACYDIEEFQLGCYCSLQVSEGKAWTSLATMLLAV